MASFPTSIVNPTDPLSTSKLNNPSHSQEHQSHNAEIVALEAKVGVNSSAVTTSHDYKLSAVTGTTKAVAGPASSTDKALAAFNGTSGNVILNTPATINTLDGSITMSSGTAALTVGDLVTAARIHTDTITEKTGSAGVTVESVLLKAGVITGTLAPGTVTANSLATELQKGWENYYGSTQFPAPSTITALGNRSYSVVYNSVDLTGAISSGMRQRFTRSVTAPTQCTSLNGTTQYYSKATPNKSTFTDDFATGWWIKPSSYAVGTIASIYNGTSGWALRMNASGQIQLIGYNAGAANFSQVLSSQSIPLNKWIHVAAQLDMSAFTATPTTSYIMLDGLDVPSTVTRGGTNPTALIQAGNLNIGAENGGTNPFPGKIANGCFYSAKVTQATILASISQTLSGSETSLASAYSFSNSIADLNTTTPNDLTANGSAVATNLDTPFTQTVTGITTGTTNFGIITAASFSTNTTVTIQVPEGDTLPTSGGVSAVSYSPHTAPYGFPEITKFRLSAYDTSGTLTNPLVTVMSKYVILDPIVGLGYVNAGTATGTMYLYANGTERRIWGFTGSLSTTGAAPVSTAYGITWPASFFTTLQSANISAAPGTATNSQYIYAAPNTAATTSAWSFFLASNSGSNGTTSIAGFSASGT